MAEEMVEEIVENEGIFEEDDGPLPMTPLQKYMRKTPWWATSVAFHGLIILCLYLVQWGVMKDGGEDIPMVTELARQDEPLEDKKDEKIFKDINEAYRVLSNSKLKAVYDSSGRIPMSEEQKLWEAKSLLRVLFDIAINDSMRHPAFYSIRDLDIVSLMKSTLMTKRNDFKRIIRETEEQLSKLKTIETLVEYKKEPEDNIFQQCIDERKTAFKHIISNAERDLEISTFTETVLKDYKINKKDSADAVFSRGKQLRSNKLLTDELEDLLDCIEEED